MAIYKSTFADSSMHKYYSTGATVFDTVVLILVSEHFLQDIF